MYRYYYAKIHCATTIDQKKLPGIPFSIPAKRQQLQSILQLADHHLLIKSLSPLLGTRHLDPVAKDGHT